jgi:malate permease and related proteins
LISILFSIFISDVLPIFLVAGTGFLLASMSGVSVTTLSKVAFYALVPCLIFESLVTTPIPLFEFGRMALFCALVIFAMGVCARLAAVPMRLDRPTLAAFLLVVMFSNAANFGLPLVSFAFGAEALSYATVFFISSAVLTYTTGVVLAASGRRSVSQALVALLRAPMLYGLAAAGIVLLLRVTPPQPVMRPVTLMSQAALPVMILVLGMQLQRAQRPDRPGLVALAVVLCLLVAPIVALALARIVGLTGPAFRAGIIEASMPTAVTTTILALEYELPASFVTNVVFVSTLLSPFTLTVLIAYLQQAG